MKRILMYHANALFSMSIRDLIVDNAGCDFDVKTYSDMDSIYVELESEKIEIFLISNICGSVSAVDVIQRVRSISPETKVMVLSHGQIAPLFAYMAVGAGAVAILPPDIGKEELIEAIKRVSQGVVLAHRPALNHRNKKLSSREVEVLRMLVQGMPLTDIAKTLGLNEKTIGTYKNRLFQKLELKDNIALYQQYNSLV